MEQISVTPHNEDPREDYMVTVYYIQTHPDFVRRVPRTEPTGEVMPNGMPIEKLTGEVDEYRPYIVLGDRIIQLPEVGEPFQVPLSQLKQVEYRTGVYKNGQIVPGITRDPDLARRVKTMHERGEQVDLTIDAFAKAELEQRLNDMSVEELEAFIEQKKTEAGVKKSSSRASKKASEE